MTKQEKQAIRNLMYMSKQEEYKELDRLYKELFEQGE